MTSLINNLSSLRGLQVVKASQRRLKGEVEPSQVLRSTPLPTLRANENNLLSYGSTSLSSSLETALALQGIVEVQDRHPQRQVEEFSNRQDFDQRRREFTTVGLGDRSRSVSNTPTREASLLFPLAPFESTDPAFVTTLNEPTQGQMLDLRSALLEKVGREISLDPTLSEAALKTKVDEEFGDGVSELVGIRMTDKGAGLSSVHIGQVDYESLGENDESILAYAIAQAEKNYSPSEPLHDLEGGDINSLLGELQRILGPEGLPIVTDLRAVLKDRSATGEELISAQRSAIDLGLSSQDSQQVNAIFGELRRLNLKTEESFDANSFLDDARRDYQSYRYGQAYSPSDIAAKALLTQNSLFLGK